jgi:hypothetical protein
LIQIDLGCGYECPIVLKPLSSGGHPLNVFKDDVLLAEIIGLNPFFLASRLFTFSDTFWISDPEFLKTLVCQ